MVDVKVTLYENLSTQSIKVMTEFNDIAPHITHESVTISQNVISVVNLAKGDKEVMLAQYVKANESNLASFGLTPKMISECVNTAVAQINASSPVTEYNPSGYMLNKYHVPSTYNAKTMWETKTGWHPGGIVSGNSGFSSASKNLPGVNKVVDYPCGCVQTATPLQSVLFKDFPEHLEEIEKNIGKIKTGKVWGIVQHLNDHHGWTREAIADWIDDLHDKGIINAEFEVESISDKEIENLIDSEGGEQ